MHITQIGSSDTEPMSVSFVGERLTWHSPVTLTELLSLKNQHPTAKIVVGNTEIGKFPKINIEMARTECGGNLYFLSTNLY